MKHKIEILASRIGSFNDTRYLAEKLYEISHNESESSVSYGDSYLIMESRDNLLGMYKLCNDLIKAIKEIQNNERCN